MNTMIMPSCLIHLLFFCSVSSAMPEDVDLLISFKNSLPNPNLLSNWNHKHLVCKFQGVTCKGGHVSSLIIRGLPLGADFSSVSAHILSLPNLEALSLSYANLTGSISSFPFKCSSRLTVLDLSSNNLRGSVSDAASLAASCVSLQSLNLSNNYIGQRFNISSPVVFPHLKVLHLAHNMITTNRDLQWLFSRLGSLTHLDLSNNNIQGTMPHITNCTSLQYLDLSSNELFGIVPAGTISGCRNLIYLNLSSNQFSGKAPPDIEACTGLRVLSLSNNNFSGEFPIMSLVIMPRLQNLELAFNNFNGSLPKSISKLARLESLDLSANKFSGPIPHSLCTKSVSNLQRLYLQDNYFTGSIPDSLNNCTKLVSLDLSLNLFSGSIPGILGSLSNLNDLIMWQNNLNGEIPAELSSLKSLRNLLLDYNNLTGTIPDELANCTGLNWISLASNQLTGSIPIWIGKLEKLVILILANNSFTGSIPPELGDCKSLLCLDLGSNKLNGSIPPTLAKQSGKIMGANLTVNNWLFLSARIRDKNRCHVEHINLEFNGIRYNDSLRIPSIRSCKLVRPYIFLPGSVLRNNMSMNYLDLSYNQLTGQIPSFSAMQSLTVLYLEHNYLSGQLSQALGGLTSLIDLDLSYNMLEGSIPVSFSDFSLSELDLSNNQLSGPIPQQGSLVTFPEYAFENNSGLCGLPLPPCSSMSKSEVDDSLLSSTTNHQFFNIWWITIGIVFCIFFSSGFVIGQYL
jgi:protein brassinosteroid insensitive 1